MENNKNKKSVKFQGDMLNFCDFIQVFVFTRNHHLNSKDNGINSQPVNETKTGKDRPSKEKDKTNAEEDKTDAEKDNKPGVSLVKVLLKTFGWDYLVGLIWICCNNVIHFFNPLLLK